MRAAVVTILLILSDNGVRRSVAFSPQPFAEKVALLRASSKSCSDTDGCLCLHQRSRCQQLTLQNRRGIIRWMTKHSNEKKSDDSLTKQHAGVATKMTSKKSEFVWNVYISQTSNKSKEPAIPASSLVQAFISLAPSPNDVVVNPAVFKKQNKQKGKGQLVRCIQRLRSDDQDGEIVSALEISNVDSVDKVCRIMEEHMKLGEINIKARECMKFYFEGNDRLERGEPSQAITLYDQALSIAKQQPTQKLPKGSILMKRARAYLKRAAKHRTILRMHVKDLTDTVPSASTMKILYQTASANPAMSTSIFQRLAGDTKVQQAKFRQIRYRHDMYEFALLHAVQDSLQATQLLPRNAKSWLLAGECLAELRKLKESNQYYQRALDIDPSMDLKGAMEKNRASQEFIDVARASGFSGDTLRLALDVAA